MPDRSAVGPALIEPDPAGIVVEIRGAECLVGTPDMVFAGKSGRSKKQKPVEPTETALNGLAMDALRRYAKAFGSKEVFLGELKRQNVVQANLPPVLRTHLEQFK